MVAEVEEAGGLFEPSSFWKEAKASYPYPESWRRLFDRKPVAQPAFFEALFAL